MVCLCEHMVLPAAPLNPHHCGSATVGECYFLCPSCCSSTNNFLQSKTSQPLLKSSLQCIWVTVFHLLPLIPGWSKVLTRSLHKLFAFLCFMCVNLLDWLSLFNQLCVHINIIFIPVHPDVSFFAPA